MDKCTVIYKNPNILLGNIDDQFYWVVNPYIKNGLKIINSSQYSILTAIRGASAISEISETTKFSFDEILQVYDVLKSKDIVNSTNEFTPPLWSSDITSLHLWIHTTNECNLRCSYCYIHTLGKRDYIKPETIQKICDSICSTVETRHLLSVYLRFAGGEPLLKIQLWKDAIINLKNRLNTINCELHIAFLTNLVKLEDDTLNFLVQSKSHISVSLDGLGHFQDQTRHYSSGKGTSDIVLVNIQKLLLNGIKPTIMTVVSNSNMDGLIELTKFAIKNNLYLRYSFVHGEEINKQKLLKTLYSCYDVYQKAILAGFSFAKLHKLCDLKLLAPFYQNCSNGLNGGAIYTNGAVFFCHKEFGLESALGHLDENLDLITVIQKGKYKNIISKECNSCNLVYVCNGGCQSVRIHGKDPYCDIYREIIPIIYRLIALERLEMIKHSININ